MHAARSPRPSSTILPTSDEVYELLALAQQCSLRLTSARERIARVGESLTGWQDAARRNRIAEREIALMAESIEPRLEALRNAVHLG